MDWIFSLQTIEQTTRELLEETGSAPVLAFHGPMGAGKTTLVHAICHSLGVKDIVSSPTFSIINEYAFTRDNITRKIFHIDLYRLNSETEAMQAGVEDCLYSGALCLVEWPEKAPSLFPPGTVHIYIEALDTENRRLQIGNN